MVKLLGLLGCLGLTQIPAFSRTSLPTAPPNPLAVVLENPRSKIQNPKRIRMTETAGLMRSDQAGRVEPWCLGFLLQGPQPLLNRLKPADRARVLAALAGLIILGFALVLLAWWGARFTRRYLKRPWPGSERHKAGGVSEFDWASKPLYEDEHGDRREEEEPRE